VPFERLVEDLAPTRSLARHPLFQVMLTLQNNTEADLDLPGIQADLLGLDDTPAKFDLDIHFGEQTDTTGNPTGLLGLINYATDLFDRGTVGVMAERLVRVLETVCADPDRPISKLDLLSEAERRRLLVEWNDTTVDYPHATLPALFEAQVARTPDAVAVVCDDTQLTYRELNEQANRLARHLVGQGVGPESAVALLMERSAEFVTAILAVFKAGGAYLPVEPDYPANRILHMLTDARPALTLTTTKLTHHLPPTIVHDQATQVVVLDDLPGQNSYSSTNLDDTDRTSPLLPQHPAYILYTSGSTGRPKGVTMPVAALTNLLAWHNQTIPGGPGRTMAQFTATSFDISIHETLSALLTGATLAISRDGIRHDITAFTHWLNHHHINEINAPNLILDALYKEATEQHLTLPHLTDITQTGEALTIT
ncbi:AMP-binding protein, partial [Streptomyces sp. NPDC056544]|uniref:AMP-binding protein n=1 Tax=Streptomyces sp. NPDC056544 TaxID=3345863 RepID=UPI003686474F